MIPEPKDQKEYTKFLMQADEKILAARRAAYDAMVDYRQAMRKRDFARAALNNGGTRPSQRDLIAAVSQTERMVKTGQLPPAYVERRHAVNPCDIQYRGRGFVAPDGRIVHVSKSQPKLPPRVIPPTGSRG